jgi:hypothetical protein
MATIDTATITSVTGTAANAAIGRLGTGGARSSIASWAG